MAEIARTVMPRDFREIDTTSARVILLVGLPRVLPTFPEDCSRAAQRQLEQLGVEVRTNTRVTNVDEQGVRIGEQRIDAACVIWAAGVQASPLGKTLGAEVDRAGRVLVNPDLSIPGYPEVFVIGDLASVRDPRTGTPVPGVAQGAIQMGVYVARRIAAEVTARTAKRIVPARPPFTYQDKGSMATIGRNRAVGLIGRFHSHGLVAWLLWAVVHILFLISFRNRVAVALR
jgi:NADH dehydrogenase